MENQFDQVVEPEIKPPITIKTAFFVVLGIHVAAILGIMFFATTKKANATSIEEDQKYVVQYAGVDEPSASPTPTPQPTATPTAQPTAKKDASNEWPKAKLELKTYPNTKKAIAVNPKNFHYTKEYVVKTGDTFYSIVKKYKLNPERLKQINNIKNENKIQIGQTLKLM